MASVMQLATQACSQINSVPVVARVAIPTAQKAPQRAASVAKVIRHAGLRAWSAPSPTGSVRGHRQAERSTICMAAPEVGEYDPAVDGDFLAVGLAHCFQQEEGSKKTTDYYVIEPIPAGAYECMVNGAVTCYEHVIGVSWEKVKSEDVSALPAAFSKGVFCDDFNFRAQCTARTWRREHAMDVIKPLVPTDKPRSDFNVNLTNKRVLNAVNEVTDADNIKQDMSIDVYGRKQDEEGAESEEDSAIKKLYNA